MEADLAEVENMAGDDIVGRRVKNDVFNRGVFYGTVTEYVKIDEPGEKDFWQVTYEDEDTGDYYRDELVPLIEAYETEAHGLGCIKMECYAGIDGEPGQTIVNDRKVRKFRERSDGLFDIIDVPVHDMTEVERKGQELFCLSQEANERDTIAQDCNPMEDGTKDMKKEGPLNDNRVRQEIHREEWENLREDIRPFRSFSEGIGKHRESRDDDIRFRAYA